jgi:FKBP-type peptidyl-prolyl cis-trans isomerase (trigger factor)
MLQLKTLDLLPMTLDTYGLPEEEYLTIFEKKAEFACKALRIVERVATDYNIKMEPKLFWDLYQEIGYATDDACRIKQKREDPKHLKNVVTHQVLTQQLVQYLLRCKVNYR